MPILLDITRLISRKNCASATGIDRVELAYARYFSNRSDVKFVKILPGLGIDEVFPKRAKKLIDNLSDKWFAIEEEDVNAHKQIVEIIERNINDLSKKKPRTAITDKSVRIPEIVFNNFLYSSLKTPAELDSEGTIYIHVSHSFLDIPNAFNWLKNSKAKGLFFIHDIIPLTFPEYCGPKAYYKHKQRMKTVSEVADLVVVNSAATRDDIASFYATEKWRCPNMAVAHLGTDHFTTVKTSPLNFKRPYFLYVSTIEARKNHAFILTVWRELIKEYGNDTPMLFVIGRRGWECESAIDLLERCQTIQGQVFELGAVSNSVLTSLMNGASGTVMPSFTEGFSLPLIEALSFGLPTIASDIKVHKELAGDNAIYASPTDGPAWKKAIMDISKTTKNKDSTIENDVLKKFSWENHFSHLSRNTKQYFDFKM